MYGSPIVLIYRPPASCGKIHVGVDQKLKISLEWPNIYLQYVVNDIFQWRLVKGLPCNKVQPES